MNLMTLDQRRLQTANCETRSPGWWAIYTRHQHEKVVADSLGAKGIEVFFPAYQALRQWKDRKKMITVALFPCYLFVRAHGGRVLPVISTPGVHSIVTSGAHFSVIPEDEIDAIRRALQEPSRVEPHPFLKCGERVRVVRGVMKGIEGLLVRKKDQCRLILSVEMLSQSAAVEVEASDIEAVQPWLYQGNLRSDALPFHREIEC